MAESFLTASNCGCGTGAQTSPHNGSEVPYLAADAPTVPRVARSIEDLRVGQVVVVHGEFGWGQPYPLTTASINYVFKHGPTTVVILSEPPTPPYVVPREAVERLREAMNDYDCGASLTLDWRRNLVLTAARALLDATEEQA